MKERIIGKLTKNLTIKALDVVNNSHLHAGHFESDDSGDTHFSVSISATELDSKSLVSSHRKVTNILKEEFDIYGLHALEIKII